MPRPLIPLSLAASLAMLACGGLRAGFALEDITMAASNCQGALPAFAGTLRARPLALQNEGSAPAFVTCSLEGGLANGGPQQSRRYSMFAAMLDNASAATVVVQCTAVDPLLHTLPRYSSKSIQLAPGSRGMIQWTPANFGVAENGSPNISCALPPSVGLMYTCAWFSLPAV